MKKFLLLLSMITTTFLFLGCPSPVLANDEPIENNPTASEPKKDEETKNEYSSEPIEYNYLPAPQTPVLPEVSGNDGSFPFEIGREYEGKDVNDFFYSFKFNEDGTGEIIQRENSEITNAFLIKYVIDSENNCFYYYIEKKRILDSTELLTYDECINEIKNNFTEAAYADDILSYINEEESKEIFEQTLIKKYGKNSKEYNEKNTPEYFNTFKGTSEYLNEVIKYFDEELTLQSFLESQISEYEDDIQKTFNSIIKYNYNKNRSNLILENPIGEYSDITFENFSGSSEEEISSEPIPYNFKPAPQAPVLPEVSGNDGSFPFEIGREYSYGGNNKVTLQFNSDGTAYYFDYDDYKEKEVNKGYEFKYAFDSENKCIYCSVNKMYPETPFVSLNNVIEGLLDYNEIKDLQKIFLNEREMADYYFSNEEIINSYKKQLFKNYTFETEAFEEFFNYSPELRGKSEEEFNELLTEKNLWDYIVCMMNGDVTKTYADFAVKAFEQLELEAYNTFSKLYKFEYSLNDNQISLKQVPVENDTFEDILIKDEGYFGLELEENNNRVNLYSDYGFIHYGNISVNFEELIFNNGFIFTYDKYDGTEYEILYTTEGTGENAKVTINWEGTEITLVYYPSESIVFDK